MKLKCPNCQTPLQVPDASAGKIVACRCGKRMRAPARKSAPAATAAGAKRSGTAAKASAGSSLVPGGSAGEIDAGLFDELTEADWKPVGAIPRRDAAPVRETGGKLLQQYGVTDSRNGSATASGNRPGLLTFIGVVNAFWAVMMFFASLAIFGLVAAIPMVTPEAPDEGAQLLMLAGGISVFAFVLYLATAVSCFIGTPACWFIVLFSYGFNLADRAIDLVGAVNTGAETIDLVEAVIGMIIGILFLAYLHREQVRRYYRIEASRLKMAAIPDVLGVVLGLSLGALATFMA